MIDDRDKAGAVQAFEICYELAWKTMERFLNEKGVEVNSPKDTFRLAAKEKMIADPEIWFEFQKYRNLTVHTYYADTVERILSIFDTFSAELHHLIKNFQKNI
jgi:nucleotidyltransferase substrate binding protein (TIGR01987 family)